MSAAVTMDLVTFLPWTALTACWTTSAHRPRGRRRHHHLRLRHRQRPATRAVQDHRRHHDHRQLRLRQGRQHHHPPGTQAAQILTWNSEGKLATSSEPIAGTKPATGTSYLYDADGTLLIRRPTTADGETVLYLGATEVHLKVTGSGATKTLTANRYYTRRSNTRMARGR